MNSTDNQSIEEVVTTTNPNLFNRIINFFTSFFVKSNENNKNVNSVTIEEVEITN